MPSSQIVHATTVAFGAGRGVLIEGPSGSGKSTLALHLLGCRAELVSDDRTVLFATPDGLFARPPHQIAGLIEVRGTGILRADHRRLARIVLVVGLGATRPPRRLPEVTQCERLGQSVAWQSASGVPHDLHGLALALKRLLSQ